MLHSHSGEFFARNCSGVKAQVPTAAKQQSDLSIFGALILTGMHVIKNVMYDVCLKDSRQKKSSQYVDY